LDPSLKRIRPSEVLSQLKNEKQRLSSVRGAFDLAVSEHLRGKSVLLIDDVVTTCATVSECALVLKKAGVAYVDVLAATLALPDALRKPADDEYDEIV
ncbi:MAG TPA: phosphoribosyltransferase family protein, partial [Candidatus Hydrogenedentes bacterium]|nr:phosphoribosyltransferase family protein [Candidatus Hydrogenedentota bacterium]